MTDRVGGRLVVASISGGKDSAALSLHLREQGIEHRRVFLDTGWEHPRTYEYLRGELASVIGPIEEVRADRTMVDLIRSKAMFPSRRIRFCTQELKVFPMQRHVAELAEREGRDVINAVGIRAEESASRSRFSEWEWAPGWDAETWRPLLRWTLDDVIAIHARHGLRPNPLYLEGAERVGCWPCIYARKSEIRHLADTDPERVALIRRLESELTDAATERRGELSERSWFQARMGGGGEPWPIDRVVEWSRTARGGRQWELFAAPASDTGCMRWGLCDTGETT